MARLRHGYSAIDTELLCASCDHGQVMESSQGDTQVVCAAHERPLAISFVVTKCSKHAKKELTRIYDTAQTVKIEAGHVWVRDGWGKWRQYGVTERTTLRQALRQWWAR